MHSILPSFLKYHKVIDGPYHFGYKILVIALLPNGSEVIHGIKFRTILLFSLPTYQAKIYEENKLKEKSRIKLNKLLINIIFIIIKKSFTERKKNYTQQKKI